MPCDRRGSSSRPFQFERGKKKYHPWEPDYSSAWPRETFVGSCVPPPSPRKRQGHAFLPTPTPTPCSTPLKNRSEPTLPCHLALTRPSDRLFAEPARPVLPAPEAPALFICNPILLIPFPRFCWAGGEGRGDTGPGDGKELMREASYRGNRRESIRRGIDRRELTRSTR